MKTPLIMLLGCCIVTLSLAGPYGGPTDARSASLAYATVAMRDVWCSFGNQAGLAWLSEPTAGLSYENRFMVKEYALQSGVLGFPLKPGTGAFGYRYFGYSRYHEMKMGLSFARKLYKNLGVGVQLNYHQTVLSGDYQSFNALSVELGILYSPREDLFIGIHVSNPNQAKSHALQGEKIPSLFQAGLAYKFLDRVNLCLETEKEIKHAPIYKVGIELEVVRNFDMEMGFSNSFPEYALGMGYHYKKFIFHLALTHHSVLGYTPHVSFIFNLSSPK